MAIRPVSRPKRPLSALSTLLGVRLVAAGHSVRPNELGFLSGLTLDSRSVEPGDLYVALPGARVHGAAFCADAVAAGAVAVLTDPDGRDRAVASGVPVFVLADPRGKLGEIACWVYGDPSSAAAAHRRHRDQRQDHEHLPDRVRAERGRAPGRPGRRGRAPGREGTAGQLADHAGGARPAGAVRGHGGARGDRRRDGSVESLAGPGPGRRHQLRRGRLHQPVAGPPRLPRRPGGLLPGQGFAVHAARHRGGERRRQVRAPARQIRARAGDHVLGGRRRRRGLARRRRQVGRGRQYVPADRAGRGRGGRVGRPGRGVQRGQRARCPGRAGRGGHQAGGRGGGRSRLRRACPAGSSGYPRRISG